MVWIFSDTPKLTTTRIITRTAIPMVGCETFYQLIVLERVLLTSYFVHVEPEKDFVDYAGAYMGANKKYCFA